MKTLLIVGKGPEGLDLVCKEDLENCDVWAPSTACTLLFNLNIFPDKIFQLHQRNVFEPWLKDLKEPERLVIIQPDIFYASATVLPAQDLVSEHGFKFASTISWMMGWAVKLGYEKIKVYGVHMRHETEYKVQRDSFFYFMGYCTGKGIEVEIPVESGIFIGNQKYGVV